MQLTLATKSEYFRTFNILNRHHAPIGQCQVSRLSPTVMLYRDSIISIEDLREIATLVEEQQKIFLLKQVPND